MTINRMNYAMRITPDIPGAEQDVKNQTRKTCMKERDTE